MAPTYARKGSSHFVYIYPDVALTYTQRAATEVCVATFGAGLPSSLMSKEERQNMGLYNVEQNGNHTFFFFSLSFIAPSLLHAACIRVMRQNFGITGAGRMCVPLHFEKDTC